MEFSKEILNWYGREGRELPWREDITAYKVWLSEIIMQQTRVAQGTPYYLRFLETYPSIKDFAEAEIDDILHLWQGLGYYSRARNMHFAANQVMNEFGGEFPDNFSDLRKLKGVGEYTAAAIVSFVFGKKKAVVDGNVFRVLSRYFGLDDPIDSALGKRKFQELADELICENNPGDYNQGIMDLGALICTPKNTDCENCPIREGCLAFSAKKVNHYPVKLKKTKVRNRYFEFFEIRSGNQLLLEKRGENDIWEGLYQLPLNEFQEGENSDGIWAKNKFGERVVSIEKVEENKHILSHQRLFSTFYRVELDRFERIPDGLELVDVADLGEYAFPKLISNYLFE